MGASQSRRREPEDAPPSPRTRLAQALLADRSPGSVLSVAKANAERTYGGVKEMYFARAIGPEGQAPAADARGRAVLVPTIMAHMAAHSDFTVPGVPPLPLDLRDKAAARATHAALLALEPDAFAAALREMRAFHEARGAARGG